MMSSVLARGRARVLGALTLLIGVLVLSRRRRPGARGGRDDLALRRPVHAQRRDAWASRSRSTTSPATCWSLDSTGRRSDRPDGRERHAGAVHRSRPGGGRGPRRRQRPGRAELDDFSDIAVDNTGTASQGNIYVVTAIRSLRRTPGTIGSQGFKASGELLFDVTRPAKAVVSGSRPDGNIWVGVGLQRMEELSPAGTPTGAAFESPPASSETIGPRVGVRCGGQHVHHPARQRSCGAAVAQRGVPGPGHRLLWARG